MAAVGGRRNRDVNDVMKERNFRQVESLRQLNEREQKRLSSSTDHIDKRCRYELMQVTSYHITRSDVTECCYIRTCMCLRFQGGPALLH